MESRSQVVILLCLVGAVCAVPTPQRRGSWSNAWQKLISEYSQAAQNGEDPGWGQPIPFNLDGPTPVLVLPIPVPVPQASKSGCDASGFKGDVSGYKEAVSGYRGSGSSFRGDASGFRGDASGFRGDSSSFTGVESGFKNDDEIPQTYQRSNFPEFAQVSSDYLVSLYKSQAPTDPELPPVVFPQEPQPQPQQQFGFSNPSQFSSKLQLGNFGFSSQLPSASFQSSPSRNDQPPTPRFKRSLMLKGELTVPRADYTEPYTAWWDASSGASRMDFHGGSASSYRKPMPDGRVQLMNMRVDNSDGSTVRRCGVAEPIAWAQGQAQAHPALPEMNDFAFDGYKKLDSGEQVEMWKREVRGSGPAVGAGRGEQLVYRHEVMIKREGRDTAVPMKYSVVVDSSVLGAESDRYEHKYTEVKEQEIPRNTLEFNVATQCEDVQPMNASNLMERSLLEPLREFTQPIRDNLYSDFFKQYTQEYQHKYADSTEETLRTNVLAQSWRWIRSATRMGASFEVGVNFLADRLQEELSVLLGVVNEDEGVVAEKFPHPNLAADSSKLPDEFDWRPRGGVTSPRYQGSCSSCWAFAVTAAVEGALFIQTSKLVPLSEQVLVDCGHKKGAHGCGGTWPSLAYDYVEELGLPALEEYTPYAEKVLKCRDSEVPVVTRISAHVNVTSNSIPALKIAIKKHAPSVVIIDAKAKSFIFYKKGVLFDDRCGKVRGKLNHAVTAVGWGVQKGEPHFIIKNSWSAGWGEGGFARLQAPANTCGVLSLPSYPRLEVKDIVKNIGGSPQNVNE